MWAGSLVWENPLEEGTATHSSILCSENPMHRGVGWATVHGLARESDTTEATQHTHIHNDTAVGHEFPFSESTADVR